MGLEKCNNAFPINNELKENVTRDIEDKSNYITFSKVFDEATKENKKIKVSDKEISCMLNSKDQNAFKELQKSEPLRSNRMETKDRLDSVVSKLAGFFRIGVSLMMAILEAIGITPEDLIDESKRPMILDALAKCFMLSDEQKKKLEKLLETC